MNFLLHRHLAERELSSPVAGVGAMLPDLWRLAGRRLREPAAADGEDRGVQAELSRGLAHHFEADRWFHTSPVFVQGEEETRRAFFELRPRPAKLPMFAHVSWELCLDGVLVVREGLDAVLGGLRRAVAEVGREGLDQLAAAQGVLPAADSSARIRFDARMDRILSGLDDGRWIDGYRTGAGLCARLGGVRAQLGLPALSGEQVAALAVVLDVRLGHAVQALEQLFVERAAAVSQSDG
ncbi:MAG: hypothetical protein JRI68_00470 [Deltaproteobacteria bacterium]|nr:hypothetical protein [Deltaproteobacteria bacterium]